MKCMTNMLFQKDAGIDVGISDFAVLDNGAKYEGPHALRKGLEKLRREQQALSRKTRGSHRYEAQRLKVARLHERVANIRADYAHQLSIRLVREYDRIAVEDLSVQDSRLIQEIFPDAIYYFHCDLIRTLIFFFADLKRILYNPVTSRRNEIKTC